MKMGVLQTAGQWLLEVAVSRWVRMVLKKYIALYQKSPWNSCYRQQITLPIVNIEDTDLATRTLQLLSQW